MAKFETCSFTGPRAVPPEKRSIFNKGLKNEVMLAVGMGVTHFVCGVLNESDMLFIKIIAEIKADCRVTLEAVAPHYGVISENTDLCALMDYCDRVFTFSECYFLGCVIKQRRYIAEQGEMLIAVKGEGKTPGMASILRCAKSRKCRIRYIEI